MKVKIKSKCINTDRLISVEDYAKTKGQTRANIYYFIRSEKAPFEWVKIAGKHFIVLPESKNNSTDNQTVTE
jgi:hypothetical protein